MFQHLAIPVPPDLAFETPAGETIVSPLADPTLGLPAQIYHWYDPELAVRWFQYAKSLIDALPTDTGIPARPPGWEQNPTIRARYVAQCKLVFDIAAAIANGFNALNVSWHTDLPTRRIYWQYLSGPIANARLLYQKDGAPVSGWYSNNGTWLPTIDASSQGSLPALARHLYTQHGGDVSKNHFVQAVGLGITLAGPQAASLSPSEADAMESDAQTSNVISYESDIVNAPFLISGLDFGTAAAADEPFCTSRFFAFPVRCTEPDPTILYQQRPIRVPISPEYIDNTEVSYDWKAFRMDVGVHFGDVPMKVYLGPYFYVQFFADIVNSVLARTPADIILGVKQFVAYWNAQEISANGSIMGVLQASLVDPISQARGTNTGLAAAGAAAGMIGAALSGVTYGVSAVVGAAVAVGLSVAAQAPDIGKVKNTGRDDLGRWKPILERGWLSGNPGDPVKESGAPVFTVREPPDGQTSATPATRFIVPGAAQRLAGSRYTPTQLSRVLTFGPTSPNRSGVVPTTSTPLSTGAKVAIAVVGAGALYVGWRATQSKG